MKSRPADKSDGLKVRTQIPLDSGKGRPATKHTSIRDEIRRRICRGRICDKLPGVRELAREFDVHGLTVRKALWALAEEKLVTAVPKKGHFVTREKITSVTMLVRSDDLETGYFGKLVRILSEKMPAYHFDCDARVMGSTADVPEFPDPAGLGLAKGTAVLTVGVQDRNFLLALMDAGFRVVALDYVPTDPWITAVGVDGVAAGAEATRHLIENGYEDILYMGQRRGRRIDADSLLLEAGYKLSLDEAGLTPRSTFAAAGTPRAGREAFERVLESGPVPDAVFAADMRLTEGIRECCRERDIRVPQDMTILGMGQRYPDLPAIAFDLDQLCEAALMLLKQIGADPDFTPRHVLVRAEMKEARE